MSIFQIVFTCIDGELEYGEHNLNYYQNVWKKVKFRTFKDTRCHYTASCKNRTGALDPLLTTFPAVHAAPV